MVNGHVRGTYILLNSKRSMLMKMDRCKRARKRCVFFEIPKDPAVLYASPSYSRLEMLFVC